MPNSYVNLFVPQGADYSEEIFFVNDDWTPVNISGYSFSGTYKTGYSANVSLPEANPANTNTYGIINIIVINSQVGNTMISMNAATTANIAAGEYVYSIVMTDNFGTETRILEGIMTVTPEAMI